MLAAAYDGVIAEYQNAATDNDIVALVGLAAAGGAGAHLATIVGNATVDYLSDQSVFPDLDKSSFRGLLALTTVLALFTYALGVVREGSTGAVSLGVGGMGLGAFAMTALAAVSAILSLKDSGGASVQTLVSGDPRASKPNEPLHPPATARRRSHGNRTRPGAGDDDFRRYRFDDDNFNRYRTTDQSTPEYR